MTLATLKEELLPLSVSRPAPTPPAPAPAAPAPAPAAPAPAPTGAPAATPPAAAAEVKPQPPVAETVHAQKGYHLDANVTAGTVVRAAEVLGRNGFMIEAVTGVDWLQDQQIEVVYDFFHVEAKCRAVLRLRVDRATAAVPTLSGVFPGAEWHERETHDFFGVRFEGLRDLKPFILPDDATFHPLLKDYAP